MMSEKFGVSRSNIREAIQKLEFFGILKSIPQSGTFVANIGVIAMKTQVGGYDDEPIASLSPNQATLAWVLNQDFVDSSVPGMKNMEELMENVAREAQYKNIYQNASSNKENLKSRLKQVHFIAAAQVIGFVNNGVGRGVFRFHGSILLAMRGDVQYLCRH